MNIIEYDLKIYYFHKTLPVSASYSSSKPGFFLLISKFMSIIEWLSLCSVCCVFQNCKIGHEKFEKFQNHCSIGPGKPSSITRKKSIFFESDKKFQQFLGFSKKDFPILPYRFPIHSVYYSMSKKNFPNK